MLKIRNTKKVKAYAAHLILFFLLVGLLFGCHQALKPNTELTNQRQWPPTTMQIPCGEQEAIFFEPRAAYIANIQDTKKYPKDTWVRARPFDDWPEDEAKPNLLLAKVVEREENWARLELLAMVDSIRQDCLLPEEITNDKNFVESLPAITKRLILGKLQNKSLKINLGADDLITGNEIYAALEAGERFNKNQKNRTTQRLAAQIIGLWKPETIGEQNASLAPLAGTAENHSVLLLLSADVETELSVVITVGTMPNGKDTLLANKIEEILNNDVPHVKNRISIVKNSTKYTEESVAQQLGSIQNDTLQMILWWNKDHVRISTQHNRVFRKNEGSWIENTKIDDAALPTATWIGALQLLGENTITAYAIERILKENESNSIKYLENLSLLASPLVQSYLTLERADWALEVLLELKSFLRLSSQKQKDTHITLMDSWTQFVQYSEDKYYDEILLSHNFLKNKKQQLSNKEKLGIADSILRLKNKLPDDEFELWKQKIYEWMNSIDKNKLFDNSDDKYHYARLQCQLAHNEDAEEVCTESLKQARSEFEKQTLKLEATRKDIHENDFPEEIFQLIKQNEAIGAGVTLNIEPMQKIAFSTENPYASEQLLNRVAEYFFNSHQLYEFLAILQILELKYAHYNNSPQKTENQVFSKEFSETNLFYLTTLDRRTALGISLLQRAALPNTDNTSALDLLRDALKLFLSNGDEANAALTLFKLARLYQSMHKTSEAKESFERGRKFAKGAQNEQVILELENVRTLLESI